MGIEELETMECMRIWDSLEELGDCLVWTGSLNKYGYPQYKSYVADGCRLVKRMVWMFHGRAIGYRVPIECTCGDKKCLNPAHMRPTTTKAIAKRAAKNGAWSSPIRAAKISASKRSAAKLTVEVAREIRLSKESGRKLAQLYGVNRTVINGIRSGARWKEYTNTNIFAQLMRQQ